MFTSAMWAEPGAAMARPLMNITVATSLIALVACGGGSIAPTPQGPPKTPLPPPSPPTAAAPVTGLLLDDVTNTGNASDIEVRFTSPSLLATVREFRVVAVTAGAPAPTTATVAALSAGRFLFVAAAAGTQVVRFDATTTDLDGNAVREGVPYRVAVVSVARSGANTDDAIAVSSGTLTLASTTLKLTYLWNHGVMLEDDTMRVVIDGHQRRTDAFFVDPPGDAAFELEAGTGRFAGIRLALGSHNHEDHILPASITAALLASPSLAFAAPGGITTRLENAPRVTSVDVPLGERRDVVVNGIAVAAFRLRHFNAFSTDFGSVENYAWLVTVGGKRVLHLGDSDLTVENLALFAALPAMDIVIVPSWGALVTATTAAAVTSTTRAGRIVATHLRVALGDADQAAVEAHYSNAIVYRTPLAFHRF